MTKHKTLQLFSAAFPLCLLILLVLVMPGLAQRSAGKAGKPNAVDTWSSGPNLPTPLVRAVGVYFPNNGNTHIFAMGGRSSDAPGSDQTHPLDYYLPTNTWTTKSATYPDAQVNNMACGLLTVGTTAQIYCVGGSQAGQTTATARVFSYDPATDSISTMTSADNWPGNANSATLPGGFTVVNNKLYIIGGFNINTSMTHQTWVFDPNGAVGSRWTQLADYPLERGYIPTTAIGNVIYTAGGSTWDGTTLHDSTDSFEYDTTTNTWTATVSIPRATGETQAINFYGQTWLLGGGRDTPNPSNEVDIYDPNCDTWTTSTPFVTPRRNFPAGFDGCFVYLAGGYDSTSTPLNTMEIYRLPMASTAVSRKVHGSAGTFDVPLPLEGPIGIECRVGPTYQLVINFATSHGVPTNVTVDSASLTCGTGTVDSISGSGTPTITVNLSGVTNDQKITVMLHNVSDNTGSGDIPISMGVLVGDTNANALVNASDISQTKSQVGQPVTGSNFREDVNANGLINASDVALVKSNSGTALPP